MIQLQKLPIPERWRTSLILLNLTRLFAAKNQVQLQIECNDNGTIDIDAINSHAGYTEDIERLAKLGVGLRLVVPMMGS